MNEVEADQPCPPIKITRGSEVESDKDIRCCNREKPCQEIFTATMSYTAQCPEGYTGDPVSLTRTASSIYSKADAEAKAFRLAKNDAIHSLNCATPATGELARFDFAVIRYIWTLENGQDLDTRTAVVQPPRMNDLGWLRNPADPNYTEGLLPACRENIEFASSGDVYLVHGGDNCESGAEAILVDFKKLSADFPDLDQMSIRLRAYWFNIRSDGNIKLQFQTYLGGHMERVGYDFVNVGGATVQTVERPGINIPTETNTDADGDEAGTLVYYTADKSADILPPA